jgi:anaerobic magnesium-protoporphyrin IX monomethyl ester cyclase
MLPPAIGLLSAVLKREGFQVELFDTTYYLYIDGETFDSDGSKADRLMARPFKMPNEITELTSDPYEDFAEKVKTFKPDLLALSATEDMFPLGIKLLKSLGENRTTTICGGVFPTFSPELALSYPEIDLVCKGEGEETLLKLCQQMEKGEPNYDTIPNICYLKDNVPVITKASMINMDANPLIDMSIFEEARFYRPMGGKVYRMFPVETHRGCPYTCAFCNSPSQMVLYKKDEGKSYLRCKSMENIKRELLYYKEEMKAEYLYFWADTFFSWSRNEFEQFADIYEEHIKLPFWCQTRVETINRERFERLKAIGCARISFGLEHGNEEFRKKVLNRNVSNKLMINNFKIVNEVGIPYSVNNILGFPKETYELAFDTILLNREIDATDRNAYPYSPFHGTPLRDVAEKLNLVNPDELVKSFVATGSILDMPQFPRKQVNGLVKTFNMYVNFPKERWPEIKIAEGEDDAALEQFDKLAKEFKSEFWDGAASAESKGIEYAANN